MGNEEEDVLFLHGDTLEDIKKQIQDLLEKYTIKTFQIVPHSYQQGNQQRERFSAVVIVEKTKSRRFLNE